MSTKGVADVVFCLDASASMEPCFEGVRRHLGDFVASLTSSRQEGWDLRFDFVAHSTGESAGGMVLFRGCSMYEEDLCEALYGGGGPSGRLFTTDVEAFQERLSTMECVGNEAPLIALDFCLDFPWREADECHRVVVFMSDERFETGAFLEKQKEAMPAIIDKIQKLRVMLYIVAPDSPAFHELASANRSEYEVVDAQGNGLEGVDFERVLSYIGKSVSCSTLQPPVAVTVERALFGQVGWGGGTGRFDGA